MTRKHPAANGSKWIRQDKRLAIYLRDGMACMYCGSGIEDDARLSLDHVTPHSQGGSNSEHNLVTCCSKCNSVRQDRDAAEFARAAADYVKADARAIIDAIHLHMSYDLAPYRAEAKAIIARRPTWQAALQSATKTR